MAETAAASAIVHEVLNEDNYVERKYPLETYLIAQDLWDVIVEDQPIGLKQFLEAKGIARAEDFEDEEKANDEASKEVQSEAEIKAWLKKNATALHVIIISCDKDALRAISGIISAKKAWKTLKAMYEPRKSDGRQLLIKSQPGEVVKPDQFKAINDEGMPIYERPFMKGKLYIHFTMEFPDSLGPEQCKLLEAVLPPKPVSELTDMELDECEETTLHDVNIEEEMRRKHAQEAYDEDEDMPGGAQRVQCAQQ